LNRKNEGLLERTLCQENSKKEEAKTPEQLKADRIERFNKNPDSFIEISDIVVAAIRSEKSTLDIAVIVGNHRRSLFNQAQCEIIHALNKARMSMDMQQEMMRQEKIIKPSGLVNRVKGAFGGGR
jgi:hypothetical protein